MKKRILPVWVICLAIVISCDNTELFLEELNTGPAVGIVDVNNAATLHDFRADSVKKSSESGVFPYRFQLSVSDFNANIDQVAIVNNFRNAEASDGFLLFQYDTILVDLEVVGVDEATHIIDLEALVLGGSELTLTFISIDEFSESDTATLELTVFDNLLPEVNYEITEDISGDLVRRIDLSTSFDQDAIYGGAISSYHWVIEGVEYSLNQDFILHPFPSSGTFDVTVFVTDNNRTQSAPKAFNIFIP